MLAGAGGTTGPVLGHVDLVHPVEVDRGVPRQQAGEPRHEAGANHQREAEVVGEHTHGQQIADVGDVVAHRDDRGTGPQEPGHMRGLRRRHGQDDGVDADQAVGLDVTDLPGERGRGALGTLRFSVGYEQLFHARCGQPLTEGPNADGAGAQDAKPHQRGSRTGSSCQPPPWGGTPPWPRTRSAAATAPATTRAATARRKTFTALAVRWWQGGSRSSCAKHTRRLRPRCRGDIRGAPEPPTRPKNRRPRDRWQSPRRRHLASAVGGASWNRTSDLILIRRAPTVRWVSGRASPHTV